MAKFNVIYASESGNTKQIAQEIFDAIRFDDKELIDIRSYKGQTDGDVFFVGYWVNHSTCSIEILDLLSSLHGKHIAVFATCGLGDTEDYYKKLEKNVAAFIPEDNNYLGAFYCLGRMPREIRRRYEEARGEYADDVLDKLLGSFDEALMHPDKQDLLKAHLFADEVFRKMGIRT